MREALFVGWFGPVAVAAIYYASRMERWLEEPLVWQAVSLLSGGALQAIADPESFDMAAYRAAVKHVIEQLVSPTASPP